MDSYGINVAMDRPDYAAMKAQGFYDMSDRYGSSNQNYMSNFALNNSTGLPDSHPTGGMDFSSIVPQNDQNMNYYQEYCRLFIANVVLTTQMKELIAEKNELITRLSELEKRNDKFHREHSTPDSTLDKSKRIRRKAGDIERHFQCPDPTCQKSYGAEGSLFQHVKLKHPEITNDSEWKMKILNNATPEANN